jgi:hypothetical protein
LALSEEEQRRLVSRVIDGCGRVQNITSLIHVLRLLAVAEQDQPIPTPFGSRDDILATFTSDKQGEKVLGASVVVLNRFGISLEGATGKAVRSNSDELHRDQSLAVLAEAGITLDHPILIAQRKYTVRDALACTIANFDINAHELCWTAVALSAYLPPSRTWRNKFGEEFSFDDVAQRLLSTPFHSVSCGGTHLLNALSVILYSDEQHTLLSEGMRRKVRVFLFNAKDRLIASQHSDGYWSLAWYTDRRVSHVRARHWSPNLDDVRSQLLVTGHLAEWMLSLPEEFDVPNETLHAAGRWLLHELSSKSTEEVAMNLCPCVHAASFVVGLVQTHRE